MSSHIVQRQEEKYSSSIDDLQYSFIYFATAKCKMEHNEHLPFTSMPGPIVVTLRMFCHLNSQMRLLHDSVSLRAVHGLVSSKRLLVMSDDTKIYQDFFCLFSTSRTRETILSKSCE